MKLTLTTEPFDHVLLMDYLREYKNPNDKIKRMIKSGDILKLKKGLYTSVNSKTHLFCIANLLFAPSYISLESALSYWGLIPEKVNNITSITNKRKKNSIIKKVIFTIILSIRKVYI